ncbi:MAG: ABC transporter substrate-binding protein [Acidisphaera sp.]|nr:ABC transporter substrate-binding protein [Acidisphaera sp.]
MNLTRRAMLGAGLAAVSVPARAQSPRIRIGALTDVSGPYRDVEGPTGTACARQAAAEFMAANPAIPVEIIMADHQNKPDVAAGIVREWFDRDQADALVQVGNTAVALACATVALEKDKVHLNTGALSSSLTGPNCNPTMIAFPLDTWCIAHSTATALAQGGNDSWFFITADYAFGHAVQDDTTAFVTRAGGKVLGSVAYPFPGTTDYSAYLVQAQASGAKVVAFANGGTDTINCVKQAQEFGLTRRGTRLAGLTALISEVTALGLQAAQGLVLTETFYWDLNDRTRAFYDRVKPRLSAGVFPDSLQAGAYGATLHYLKAVKEMGVAQAKASGRATVAAMKRMPTDDDCFGPGRIREDGRAIHPAYLLEAKKPEESHRPGDLFKVLATTPAEQAFRPLAEGHCPLVHA